MESEPIVLLRELAEGHNKFVLLLCNLAVFYEDLALRLGDCEDPILAEVVVHFDLHATIEESRMDVLLRETANAFHGQVDSE